MTNKHIVFFILLVLGFFVGVTFFGISLAHATISGTSTFEGIDISDGCFAVNGTCISTGGGAGTVNAGTINQAAFYPASGTTIQGAANILTDGTSSSTVIGTFNVKGNTSILASNYPTNAGYLSIGTTTANSPIFIDSDQFTNLQIDVRSYKGGAAGFQFCNLINCWVVLDAPAGFSPSDRAGDFEFGILNGSTALTLDSSGTRVGINGSSTPTAELSVQGNAFLSGNLTNVANITATGTLRVADVATFSGGFISTASSTMTGDLNTIANFISKNGSYFDTSWSANSFMVTGSLDAGPGAPALNTLNCTSNQTLGQNSGDTAPECKTLQGTAGQITVTNSAGAYTLSVPTFTQSGTTISQVTANDQLSLGSATPIEGGQLFIQSTSTTARQIVTKLSAGQTAEAITVLRSTGTTIFSVGGTGVVNANTGIISSSSTVTGVTRASGEILASSTILSDGLVTLKSGILSTASSTFISSLRVSNTGTLFATTTLLQNATTTNFTILSNKGTTTLLMATSTGVNQKAGGCIQMPSSNGPAFRIYIGTAGTLVVEQGTCS